MSKQVPQSLGINSTYATRKTVLSCGMVFFLSLVLNILKFNEHCTHMYGVMHIK